MQILSMAVYIHAELRTFICKVISISKISDFSLGCVQQVIHVPKTIYAKKVVKVCSWLILKVGVMKLFRKIKKFGNQKNDVV